MLRTRFVFTIILSLCFCAPGYPEKLTTFITQLSAIDELPSNTVGVAFNDADGFMWFGTRDGLCRYDGYRVKTWRSSMHHEDVLTDNDIIDLAEDREKNLFIGTRRGLNKMDAKRLLITHPSDPELLDYEIRAVVPDDDGSIWVGSYNRLVRTTSDMDSVWKYDTSLPVTSVNTVFKDNDGNIWVSFWKKGLYLYNRGNDRFVKLPVLGRDDNPMRIVQTGDSYIIGTWGEGLWKMKKTSDGWYEYDKIDIKGDNGTLSDTYSMVTDDSGHIWIITHSGLYMGVIEENCLVLEDTSALGRSMSNMLNRVVKDKDGNIWVTAWQEGAYMINRADRVIKTTKLPSSSNGINMETPVLTAVFDDGDCIWFNQRRQGLGIYNPKERSVKTYKEIGPLSKFNELEELSAIVSFENDDILYLCPQYYPSIYMVKRDGTDIKMVGRIHFDNVGDGGAPRHLAKDSHGNLWIATDKQLLLRTKEGTLRSVNELPDIQALVVDKSDGLWYTSLSQGINRVELCEYEGNIKTDTHNVVAPGLSAYIDMRHDMENDTIWAVSKLGHLLGIDTKNKGVADKTAAVNLLPSEYLQNIVVDNLNNKWISTAKMIYKFSPDFSKCVQFKVSEINNRNNSLNADALYFNPEKSLIYYGCNGGFTALTTDYHQADVSDHPSPVISDVKISGIPIDNIIDGNDYSAKEITLPVDAKDIQFELSTLQYANQGKIRFSYRLKGIDDDWVDINDGAPMAFYNSIPKGRHILEIRATDENGTWGQPTIYVINKIPAWYETWWAYMCYTIIACVLIAVAYLYFKRRLAEKNAIRIAQLEKKNMEELTEMKLKYFANISHDFLSPITIISCLIDDLETSYGKIGSHLDKVRFNLAKVKSLIQQILDYRKMETGHMSLCVTKNELCGFIDRICKNHFQPLMDKKHINFNYNPDCDLIEGYFDTDKVEKILFNIISNAYKYTPEGGAVNVEVRKKVSDGIEFAVIKVSDTGIGISQKDLEKIFNRFYTVGRDESVESNGIGLSLVKDLIELHHGHITAESTVGKGSVFTLEFPVSKESYSEDELADISIVADGETPHLPQDLETIEVKAEPKNRDITLLLVEDNEELRSLMGKIFARSYQVLVANNGKEALDIIEKNDVDIIVSDLMMPEMDGLELCIQLKSNIKTSHIPIILLTAKNRSEDRIDCYKAGADAYIAKPFELPVLLARIDSFIKSKQNRQEKFKDTPNSDAASLELSTLDKEFLDKVIGIINQHLEDDNFDIDCLADGVYMSRSSLYRKIKIITGMSPVELVRNTRLKRSYELLKEGVMSVSEVAYTVGFSNPKYFSTCFKEQFGISPRDVNKS